MLIPSRTRSIRRSRTRTFLRLKVYEPLLSIWKNILRDPLEISIRFLLSFTFIGIFVALASGSVLSAKIVSDSVALSSSGRCWAPYYSIQAIENAFAYSRQCYNASNGAEGCSLFFNQSIGYTSESSGHCPWVGKLCALRNDNASYTLDTGFISTKTIGINAQSRYSFRKRTTCAPLEKNFFNTSLEFVGDFTGQYYAYRFQTAFTGRSAAPKSALLLQRGGFQAAP